MALAFGCAIGTAMAVAMTACGSSPKSSATSPDASVGDDDGGEGTQGGVDGGSSGGATGSSSGGGSSSSSGGTSASHDGGSADGATAYDYSVYQHHKNGSRNGLYIDPVLTWSADAGTGNAVTTHVVSGFTGAVATSYMGTTSTDIFAQPLYVENGPGGVPAFVVVTELNHVTTYNAATGAILWDNGEGSATGSTISYGAPATGGTHGGFVPLGITGTPFIDYSSGEGVIYFDAMTEIGTPLVPVHRVWAVKMADGSPLPNWPVNVSAVFSSVDGGANAIFNAPYQNQRGALQLVNGTLYVPFGGLNGDQVDPTKPYYGWVIAIPTSDPQHPTAWHTMAPRGGIWGPGALPTDGTYVYPVTGNTSAPGTSGFTAPSTWGGGEAVIRLGAGATFSGASADYYTPSNWADLDDTDADLGGASEVLVDTPASTSYPHLVAVGGKDKNFYLLNRDNLGGLGGELFKAQLATGQFKGAPAAYTTKKGTYVAFYIYGGGTGVGCSDGGNLVSIKITPGVGTAKPTAAVAWCAPGTNTSLGSPIVTTTDGTSDAIVWDADTSLWAFDGDTGASVFGGGNTSMGGTAMQYFNTPIAIGGGRLAVLVNGQLFVFSAP